MQTKKLDGILSRHIPADLNRIPHRPAAPPISGYTIYATNRKPERCQEQRPSCHPIPMLTFFSSPYRNKHTTFSMNGYNELFIYNRRSSFFSSSSFVIGAPSKSILKFSLRATHIAPYFRPITCCTGHILLLIYNAAAEAAICTIYNRRPGETAKSSIGRRSARSSDLFDALRSPNLCAFRPSGEIASTESCTPYH